MSEGESHRSNRSRRSQPAAERLDVQFCDGRGRPVPSAARLARWLGTIAPRRARGMVAIALVGSARMRALNKAYRREDYATDVLSFPNRESHVPNRILGDIVIARDVARRQAREHGHSEFTELRVLALHGLLHLLGYDHERDGGRMRRVEARLLRKGGVREGLIARARQ
jgi:probable rRNA maturation factor